MSKRGQIAPGQVIRRARGDLSLRRFAYLLGVSHEAVAQWESNRADPLVRMTAWAQDPRTPVWKSRLAREWLNVRLRGFGATAAERDPLLPADGSAEAGRGETNAGPG